MIQIPNLDSASLVWSTTEHDFNVKQWTKCLWYCDTVFYWESGSEHCLARVWWCECRRCIFVSRHPHKFMIFVLLGRSLREVKVPNYFPSFLRCIHIRLGHSINKLIYRTYYPLATLTKIHKKSSQVWIYWRIFYINIISTIHIQLEQMRFEMAGGKRYNTLDRSPIMFIWCWRFYYFC